MTHRKLLATLAATAALGLFACDGDDGTDPTTELPPAVSQSFALKAFDSCEALETFLEDTAVQQMKEQMTSGGYYGGIGVPERALAADDSAPAAAMPTGGQGSNDAAPTATTTTNNQVAGVDEADFVKNDATRTFMVTGNRLVAVKHWPPQDMALEGQLEIEGRPSQLLLHAEEDRVVVFSAVYLPGDDQPSTKPQPDIGMDAIEPCYGDGLGRRCGWHQPTAVKITIVDVSDLSTLKVVRQLYLPGSYVDGRSIDNSVRVVLRDDFDWPAGLRYWPEEDATTPKRPEYPLSCASSGSSGDPDDENGQGGSDGGCTEPSEAELLARKRDQERFEAAYEKWLEAKRAALIEENEKLIRAQTLEDWLREGQAKTADGTLVDLGYECTNFHYADVPVRLGLASVVTLNLAQSDQLDRTHVVGEVHEIYASAKSLYLASQHWWWRAMVGQQNHTYLHKFDISDPNRAIYRASGGVPGYVINQFAMDEHDDHLRVATIINRNLADETEPWRTVIVNRVSVLGEKSGRLEIVGQTKELAENERIQSARFIGDKGYLVTFEQIDPLFTLDLSEPAAPTIVGELKVPGFSSYIHPLGADHLLTIGTYMPEPDADGRVDWSERKVQLAVFDVSDFANPKQKFIQLIGSPNANSEAQWEHKAFNFFAEKGLLAVPFSDWGSWTGNGDDYWSHFVSELRIFHIDVNGGITPKGAVSMSDVYQQRTDTPIWYWYYSPWVRRSVMNSDGENEFVYAISDAGIRVTNVETPRTPIQTVVFPSLDN